MSFCPFPQDGDSFESSGDAAALRQARETAARRETERFLDGHQAPAADPDGAPSGAAVLYERVAMLQARFPGRWIPLPRVQGGVRSLSARDADSIALDYEAQVTGAAGKGSPAASPRFPEDPHAPSGAAHGEPGPVLYAKLRAMALQQAKRDQDLRTRETILAEREASLLTRAAALDARERDFVQREAELGDQELAFAEECHTRRERWQGWLCAFVITGLIELMTGAWLAYAARVWGMRG